MQCFDCGHFDNFERNSSLFSSGELDYLLTGLYAAVHYIDSDVDTLVESMRNRQLEEAAQGSPLHSPLNSPISACLCPMASRGGFKREEGQGDKPPQSRKASAHEDDLAELFDPGLLITPRVRKEARSTTTQPSKENITAHFAHPDLHRPNRPIPWSV